MIRAYIMLSMVYQRSVYILLYLSLFCRRLGKQQQHTRRAREHRRWWSRIKREWETVCVRINQTSGSLLPLERRQQMFFFSRCFVFTQTQTLQNSTDSFNRSIPLLHRCLYSSPFAQWHFHSFLYAFYVLWNRCVCFVRNNHFANDTVLIYDKYNGAFLHLCRWISALFGK